MLSDKIKKVVITTLLLSALGFLTQDTFANANISKKENTIKRDTTLFMLARKAFAQGKLNKALRYVNKALRRDNTWEYRSYKAEILRMKGKELEAIAIYEQEALQPTKPLKNYQWIVMTLVVTGQSEMAMHRINDLEVDYPQESSLQAQKAWIYAKQGDYHRAVECYGNNDAALGWVYALKGDKENARKHLQKLIDLNKNEWWNKWDIALIYAALPERDKALKLISEIVETLRKENREELVKLGWRMSIESDYDNLRKHEEFKQLIRRTGYRL